MSRPRIHKASIAVASDGSIIANVHGYAGETDPEELLRRAVELGGSLFVGVRLRRGEARDLLSRVDGAGHEGAGAALVRWERRRKKKADKDGRRVGSPKPIPWTSGTPGSPGPRTCHAGRAPARCRRFGE